MKETQELAIGLLTLAAILAKHFKDGVQLGKDAPAIWAEISGSEEVKLKLEAAYKDVALVKDEVKAISVADGFALVSAIAPEVLKLVEAFKSPEVVEPAPVA